MSTWNQKSFMGCYSRVVRCHRCSKRYSPPRSLPHGPPAIFPVNRIGCPRSRHTTPGMLEETRQFPPGRFRLQVSRTISALHEVRVIAMAMSVTSASCMAGVRSRQRIRRDHRQDRRRGVGRIGIEDQRLRGIRASVSGLLMRDHPDHPCALADGERRQQNIECPSRVKVAQIFAGESAAPRECSNRPLAEAFSIGDDGLGRALGQPVHLPNRFVQWIQVAGFFVWFGSGSTPSRIQPCVVRA